MENGGTMISPSTQQHDSFVLRCLYTLRQSDEKQEQYTVDDRSITLAIKPPNPTLSFGTHQTRAKEYSQQCQAGAHHNQQQEHDERVLLAHAAIRLIKPVG